MPPTTHGVSASVPVVAGCGGVAARPTSTCSPSVSTRARFTVASLAFGRAPPAASTASITREPAGSRTTPGRRTLPATCTTTSAGGLAMRLCRRRDGRSLAVRRRRGGGCGVSGGGCGGRCRARGDRDLLGRGLGTGQHQDGAHQGGSGDQHDDGQVCRMEGVPGRRRRRVRHRGRRGLVPVRSEVGVDGRRPVGTQVPRHRVPALCSSRRRSVSQPSLRSSPFTLATLGAAAHRHDRRAPGWGRHADDPLGCGELGSVRRDGHGHDTRADVGPDHRTQLADEDG